MGRFGEDHLGLMFVAQPKNVARIAGGKVEDRLPEGDENVLGLPGDKRFLDQLSPSLGNGHRFPVMACPGEFSASLGQLGIDYLFGSHLKINAWAAETLPDRGPRRCACQPQIVHRTYFRLPCKPPLIATESIRSRRRINRLAQERPGHRYRRLARSYCDKKHHRQSAF